MIVIIIGNAKHEVLSCYPPSIWIVVIRFICGIVMHYSIQNEFTEGLRMMKFVVNHPWKFRYVFSAFMIGFFKVLIASLVELLNIFVLCSNTEVMEILYNFIALCVIIEFNDMFAGVL